MSELPYDQLMAVQAGTLAYRYRGRPMWKNPFDLALYPLLLERARPRTLIEIGSAYGGSALWFADQGAIAGLDLRIVSVDVQPPEGVEHPAVTFLQGDAGDLGAVLDVESLPRPLLVIEDADHRAGTTAAGLGLFSGRVGPRADP